jgi:hypothetical protein
MKVNDSGDRGPVGGAPRIAARFALIKGILIGPILDWLPLLATLDRRHEI